MLKRSRASSPLSASSSADSPIFGGDLPSAKRQRTAAPNAWDGLSRRTKLRFSTQGEDEKEYLDDGELDGTDDDEEWAVSDEEVVNPSLDMESAGDSYAAMNSLLHDLNQQRMLSAKRHSVLRGGSDSNLPTSTFDSRLSAYREEIPPPRFGQVPRQPPASLPSFSSDALYKTQPIIALPPRLRGLPLVPRHQGVMKRQSENMSKTGAGPLSKTPSAPLHPSTMSAEEEEAVRIRYEEMNRVLGSLVLSRRRAPE